MTPTEDGNSTAGFSRRLAVHAASADVSKLSPKAIAATKASALDQFGVILAASGLSAMCEPFIRMAHAEGGNAATVIGCGLRSSMSMAAFANGAMAHALDYEDTHDATLVHPMASVLPAALAVAEATGASGADLVAAVAVGADISCRLGLAFEGNPERSDGFLLTPFVGVYGATAAVGRLLGSSAKNIEQAFSLAFSQIAGSAAAQHYADSHLRGIRDAFTARAAVTAGLLAHDGVKGFDRPLEGPAGYFDLYVQGRFSAEKALDELGLHYEIEEVSFKPWPSCRGTHAFIESALALAQEFDIDQAQIVGIHATVSPFFRVLCEPMGSRANPVNAVAAKFSIPFTVGIALAKRSVGFHHFEASGLTDPSVLRLARMVTHNVAEDWGPRESTRGALELQLSDGRRMYRDVLFPRGHPKNPMSMEELKVKFLDCARFARAPLEDARISKMMIQVAQLDTLTRAADLLD